MGVVQYCHLETCNSQSVALRQMGFGKNKNSISEWRIQERKRRGVAKHIEGKIAREKLINDIDGEYKRKTAIMPKNQRSYRKNK